MYGGVIVPLVTPVDRNGEVVETDVASLTASVRADVAALMPALSSGEGWLLSERQWAAMVSCVVRNAGGCPVIAGVMRPDTAGVLDGVRGARKLGAAAVAVTAPFGAGVSQPDIFRHYSAVADTGVPWFVYNESAVSGNVTELTTLIRISELPGVVGVKESSGDPRLTRRLARAVPVPVLVGWENLISQVPEAAGIVGPLANLEPALLRALLDDPVPDRQQRVDQACRTYGVLDEDWYLCIKRELVTRNTITSAYPVAPGNKTSALPAGRSSAETK